MPISFFTGLLGSGKTLFLVWLALEKHKTELHNLPIYANFRIDLKYVHTLTYDLIKELTDVVFFIDEVQMWFDARQSMTNENIELSHEFTKLRKKGTPTYMTSQLHQALDLRGRRLVNYYTECYELKDRFVYYSTNWAKKTKITIMKTYAKKYLYTIYDTKEIIEPHISPDKKALDLKRLYPKKFYQKAQCISETLEYTKKPTKTDVELDLLHIGESLVYTKYVYLFLKRKFEAIS